MIDAKAGVVPAEAATFQAGEPKKRRRPVVPSLLLALVDETARRFLDWHTAQGGRLNLTEHALRAAIGEFLWSEAGPIGPDARGRREVYRGVLRLLARQGTEHVAAGETPPRAATPASAPATPATAHVAVGERVFKGT